MVSDEEIYHHWKKAREQHTPFVIAINAAVLYSVFHKHSDYKPIRDAYILMSHSVVFHNESLDAGDMVVFDLSKREALTTELLKQAIDKLTDDKHYTDCTSCPLLDSCDVHKNRKLLHSDLFQERLCILLKRVSLKGYHATVRELQSLIAYLIFGNRNCKQLAKSIGNDQYNLVNLIYTGTGTLFDRILDSIDPVEISHPIWDERILLGDIPVDSWIEGFERPFQTLCKPPKSCRIETQFWRYSS